MSQKSKNARAGAKSDVNYCQCGGIVEMRTVFQSGKMKHFAQCNSCQKTARKPKDLK